MAQVHRFRKRVAVHVGSGETVYFPAEDARRLGLAILNCANDIESCAFVDSDYETVDIDEQTKTG